MVLESAAEIAAGVGVELFVCSIAAMAAYRLFAGRFLLPKRENVLPTQRGVIMQGDHPLRVVEPGGCWVRPGQKVVLCDIRPRKLQLEGFEVLTADNVLLRISLSGEYSVDDPIVYLQGSSNANNALYFELRRLLTTTAREQVSQRIMGAQDAFQLAILDRTNRAVQTLGLRIASLQIWNIFDAGRIHIPSEPEGLIH